MFRRLALFAICFGLVIGPGPADAGLLHRLLRPFLPAHHPAQKKHAAEQPGEIVWSGLVMADNAEKPQPIPSELASLEETLKELFGYNQFEIIAQSKTNLRKGDENWDAASKHFKLHVDAQGPSEGGYVVNLKLVQHDDTEPPADQVVLDTDTKLSKPKPPRHQRSADWKRPTPFGACRSVSRSECPIAATSDRLYTCKVQDPFATPSCALVQQHLRRHPLLAAHPLHESGETI